MRRMRIPISNVDTMTAAACVGVSYWRNSIPESLVYYPLDSTDWIVPSFENFRATPSDSSCTHDRNRLAAAVHEIKVSVPELLRYVLSSRWVLYIRIIPIPLPPYSNIIRTPGMCRLVLAFRSSCPV